MKGNTDIPQGSPVEAPLNPEPAMLQLAEYVRVERLSAAQVWTVRGGWIRAALGCSPSFPVDLHCRSPILATNIPKQEQHKQ